MFWKRYKHNDNNYGYFGIGFMASGKVSDINYPNTFFFRLDDDYIYYQKRVLPYSIMKKDKNGKRTFEIYWNQVWQGLEKNMHYKKLKNTFALRNGMIDIVDNSRANEDCRCGKNYGKFFKKINQGFANP